MKARSWVATIQESRVKIFASLFVSIFSFALPFALAELQYFLSHGRLYSSMLKSTKVKNHEIKAVLERHFKFIRRPFSIKKRKFRVLAIGGSTTYGLGLSAEQAWPSLLEKGLNKLFPGLPVEVVNLGMLGGNISEYILNTVSIRGKRHLRESFLWEELNDEEYLTEIGWKDLDPDFIILAPQINDLAPDLYYHMLEQSSPFLLGAKKYLLVHFKGMQNTALGFYLKRALMKSMEDSALKLDISRRIVVEQRELSLLESQLKSRIKDFLLLWNSRVPIVIVRFPTLFNDFDTRKEDETAHSYLGENYNPLTGPALRSILAVTDKIDIKVLKEVAKEHKIPFLCPRCDLQRAPFSRRIGLFLDPIHMNGQGHRLISSALLPHLRDRIKVMATSFGQNMIEEGENSTPTFN